VPRYDPGVGATGVYSLNVHASYACRHSGACCTAGWSIPVEPHARALLATTWLVPDADGACPQFDQPSGLCRVHRDHGERMLPESCHHFPRRALVDPRGTFVTLSHFCPTAASLLLEHEGPLEVVSNPPAFPAARAYDGLDAMGEWPPLLRPNVLFDYDSFALWERYLVATLGSSDADVTTTLRTIAATGHRLRSWTAADGPLVDWADRVLHSEHSRGPVGERVVTDTQANRPCVDLEATTARYERFLAPAAYARACAAVPAGLTPPAVPERLEESDERWVGPGWNSHSRHVLRFLAAKAFASWSAYQARGIRTQIAELFMTAMVVRVECVRASSRAQTMLDPSTLLEAIRASDWLLVHLADRKALLAWLGEAEA
jgi:hypothetical protein